MRTRVGLSVFVIVYKFIIKQIFKNIKFVGDKDNVFNVQHILDKQQTVEQKLNEDEIKSMCIVYEARFCNVICNF